MRLIFKSIAKKFKHAGKNIKAKIADLTKNDYRKIKLI